MKKKDDLRASGQMKSIIWASICVTMPESPNFTKGFIPYRLKHYWSDF